MGHKRYVRIKAPPEFDSWIQERNRKISSMVSRDLNVRKKLSKMDTMRIISSTDGVDINPDIWSKVKKMVGVRKS